MELAGVAASDKPIGANKVRFFPNIETPSPVANANSEPAGETLKPRHFTAPIIEHTRLD